MTSDKIEDIQKQISDIKNELSTLKVKKDDIVEVLMYLTLLEDEDFISRNKQIVKDLNPVLRFNKFTVTSGSFEDEDIITDLKKSVATVFIAKLRAQLMKFENESLALWQKYRELMNRIDTIPNTELNDLDYL